MRFATTTLLLCWLLAAVARPIHAGEWSRPKVVEKIRARTDEGAARSVWRRNVSMARFGKNRLAVRRDTGVAIYVIQPGVALDRASLEAMVDRLDPVPHASLFVPAEDLGGRRRSR
jgi:hypothetical protein